MNRTITSGLATLGAIGALTLGTACGDDQDRPPAPEDTTSAEPSPTPSKKEPKKSERADLVSFRLDDRSKAGVPEIWIAWTIKNNSSEKSDYEWDWEAVDANGTRLENSTELATNVQPGQTTKGETPTTLESAKGIKLNITEFDRTAAL
ncbi:hypothetical protein [Streptomyces sp. WMMB 322]|uniref:hypothetical protein n=1 Tax=Streptomyces sp. WMMB 322 TaxID=1286821 RepID=UPI0006E3E37B|nr:hypothetical protein [Streptomyces sp. WMMB 322]SCK13621.1 hypothetical protein H180DRAFT_00839 [Streptomyces sp. WMMB 322]